ncbi:MAG TPA: choice-of-anchor D domain-containing protein, partial [Candidatus Cloacimonetes bacterium]|nr:choice-of-anchor D domain-containing protein [Candidatus Cloacimonadota bacterium]
VSIPLTGITGTKYFAFYAESTISNGDNDLFVDNVLIREIPDNPIFVINPESHDFDDIMVNTSASQVFTIINNGGGALIIDSIEIDGDDAFSLENLPELPTTLGAGDTATFGAVFAPSAGGDYSAIITVIDNLNTRYSVNAGPKRSRNTGSRAANTVTLTGSCFDPTIRTFPFFEGFEDGNTHNSTTISQWEQIIGSGTKQWTANNTFTDRNRTPRTGSWNAFLSWGGESTLIRPIMLEANQEYKLTFYARQDNANSTLANVKAAFGAGNTLDDLTETIIEQTGVVDGDYQEFSGVFSTETGGIYFIGITGWIDSSPWYLILDDITIDYNYIVTPNDHADVGGDTTASVTGDGFVGAIEVPMAPENLTPIPNPSFVVINHQVWQLIGTGEINLRFDNNGTEDIWFSHVVGGAWFAQEIPAGGHINVSVDLDAKDASLEFALGTGGNPTLPVELSYFNAVFMLNENSVKLSWKTESETQMLGYQIYRSMNTELANAILITPVIVTASNSSTGDSYSYLDKEVESGTYYYWLEAVSYNSSDYYGYQTVVIDIPSAPELPEISSMGNAYPNPFKNATSIDIAIKGGETGSFTIYNMLGQAVYREKLSEGNVTIQWHGKDNNGNRCGSGVYFYKLVTPTKAETKKMVIMK